MYEICDYKITYQSHCSLLFSWNLRATKRFCLPVGFKVGLIVNCHSQVYSALSSVVGAPFVRTASVWSLIRARSKSGVLDVIGLKSASLDPLRAQLTDVGVSEPTKLQVILKLAFV